MLPPSRIEIAKASAGAPDARTIVCGGSTYPRRTVATSWSCTTWREPGRLITLSRKSSTVSKLPDGSSEIRSSPV